MRTRSPTAIDWCTVSVSPSGASSRVGWLSHHAWYAAARRSAAVAVVVVGDLVVVPGEHEREARVRRLQVGLEPYDA